MFSRQGWCFSGSRARFLDRGRVLELWRSADPLKGTLWIPSDSLRRPTKREPCAEALTGKNTCFYLGAFGSVRGCLGASGWIHPRCTKHVKIRLLRLPGSVWEGLAASGSVLEALEVWERRGVPEDAFPRQGSRFQARGCVSSTGVAFSSPRSRFLDRGRKISTDPHGYSPRVPQTPLGGQLKENPAPKR